MAANYYLVLGVAPDANLNQIKRAFRHLTHRYHPDHAGAQSDERFQRIKEAYDTLRDPVRREHHNRELIQQRPRPWMPPVVDLFQSFQSFSPSAEQIRQAFVNDFARPSRRKTRTERPVGVEVVLTPRQAAAGHHLALAVPVYQRCAACDGNGHEGAYRCHECDGHGLIEEQGQVDVLIPRGTADGTIIPVSLRPLGAQALYLNVIVRIGQ